MSYRRAANRLDSPTPSPGFVTDQLKKTDANQNQTLAYVFERTATGLTTEEPSANIAFTDGSPTEVPEL